MTCAAVHPNGRDRCERAEHECGRHVVEFVQSGMYRHTVVVTWSSGVDCPQPEYPEIDGS